MERFAVRAILLLLTVFALTGCGQAALDWKAIEKDEAGGGSSSASTTTSGVDPLKLNRSQASDQGAGETYSIIGPGGKQFIRTTVGGAYERGDVSSAGYKFRGGIHRKATGVQ